MQYNYDSNGAIFSYFVVTLFSLLLLPTTLSMLMGLFPSKDAKDPSISCCCEACLLKQAALPGLKKSSSQAKRTSLWKWALLLLSWVAYGAVLHQAFTLKQVEDELWDPYKILGVDPDADDRSVKKAFKKLSLLYHPDKVKEAEKEEAEKKFVDISKAYKVLTDEEARKLFDEFGHPDGKQGKWAVVLTSRYVDSGLTHQPFSWDWPYRRDAKVTSKNKILSETMGVFYRDLNDGLVFRGIFETLAKAEEFQLMELEMKAVPALAWKKLEEKVIEKSESASGLDYKAMKKVPAPHSPQNIHFNDQSRKALLLLSAHFLRTTPSESSLAELQASVVDTAALLIHGLLQIAQSRNWIRVALQILNFSQLFMQALLPHQSPLLQLPYIDSDTLKSFTSKKRKVEDIASFMALTTDQRREILASLSPHQFEVVESVAKQYPRIEVAKAEYRVYGDPVIVPSSLVTLSVKFRCLYGDEKPGASADNDIPDPEEEKAGKKWWVTAPNDSRAPHTPYFPSIRKPSFSVILANRSIGRLIGLSKVYGATQDHVARIQFQAPPEVGSWTFQVYIRSDSYYKCADVDLDLKLTVTSADELPEENFDDTISEPEDHIVGYEKPVKKTKKKPAEERGEFDDSSDSDDESDDEDDDDLDVEKSPDNDAARTNLVYLSAVEFQPTTRYILVEEQVDNKVQVGSIGTTLFQRRFANLSLGQDVRIRASFLKKGAASDDYFDGEDMAKLYRTLFNEQIFSIDQVVGMEVVEMEGLKGGAMIPSQPGSVAARRGILMSTTAINFTKAADSTIRIKGGSGSGVSNAIIKPDFNFANLGIGGLDDEFSNIFRRAFVSRIFPPAIVERMGIQHVKGILLYGPP
ncbi:secretory subunit, partial [Kappamyces sp. JEL0680]